MDAIGRSLLSLLETRMKEMIDEAFIPESYRIGEGFEDYVRNRLFVPSYYTLVERSPSYRQTKNDYIESALKPDFTFRDKWTQREFYVEAKFRGGYYNDKVTWCTRDQLNRYREYAREKDFFLLLGIGDNPQSPRILSLLPLHEALYTDLYLSRVYKHQIDLDRPVSSKVLWG